MADLTRILDQIAVQSAKHFEEASATLAMNRERARAGELEQARAVNPAIGVLFDAFQEAQTSLVEAWAKIRGLIPRMRKQPIAVAGEFARAHARAMHAQRRAMRLAEAMARELEAALQNKDRYRGEVDRLEEMDAHSKYISDADHDPERRLQALCAMIDPDQRRD